MFELFMEVVNINSLSLTIVYIFACTYVFRIWGPSFKTALNKVQFWLNKVQFWKRQSQEKIENPWTPEEWLVVGIFSGFLGSALDNIFWGIVWTLKLYHEPLGDTLLEVGPFANLIFRQGIGIWAVLCHLIAAQRLTANTEKVDMRNFVFVWAGCALLLTLTIF